MTTGVLLPMTLMTRSESTDRLTAALARDLDGTFPAVVRQHQNGLYSGALRMLGNPHDAEDVVQEALVCAYRALEGYNADRIGALRLPGWLWTITANLCRNRIRSRARRPESSLPGEDPAAAGPGPEDTALSEAGEEALAGLLMDLPFAMRSAIVLHHVVGLPYEEISAALDRPPATIRSDVHRGLARLRTALEEAS